MLNRVKSPATPLARVLLVDDNRSGLAARRAVLHEMGYATHGASTPAEALESFTSQEFDLVVTDFKMPEIDGVELIRQLRLIKADIPVILLSGFVDALGLNELNTGANAVIMKSSNEVQHLMRSASRFLKVPRKPARAEKPAPRARKKTAG